MKSTSPHPIAWPVAGRSAFQRQTAPGGAVFYASRRWTERGVRHVFTTRQGGVSQGVWASLNLGGQVGDDPDCVAENRRRVGTALGVAEADLVGVEQVHGGTVAIVTREGTAGWRLSVPQADALVTDVPGLAVSVRVADCLPLLLADRRGRAVAAVHGGWRSLAAGIVGRTLDGLARRYGVAAEDCLAALGPALGPCCFEVGEEVAAIFAHLTPRAVHRPAGRRPRVDLGAVARLQLQAAGVPAEQIEGLDRCTACHAGEFFSHRRDQGRTGRLVGAVVCGGNFVKVENVFG